MGTKRYFRPSFILLFFSFLISGCTSTSTDFKVHFSSLSGDTINVLFSKSKTESNCKWGQHSCTYRSIDAELFLVKLPVEQVLLNRKQVFKQAVQVSKAKDDVAFLRASMSGNFLVDAWYKNIVSVCDITMDPECEKAASIKTDLDASFINKIDPNSSNKILIEHKLLSLPKLAETKNFLDDENYQELLSLLKSEFDASPNTPAKLYYSDANFIVGIGKFGNPKDSLVGYQYDLSENAISEIKLPFVEPKVGFAVLDVLISKDDIQFLIDRFDFEDGTFNKILDETGVFSVKHNTYKKLSNFEYFSLRPPIWDHQNKRFIYVDWSNQNDGLKVSFYEY